MAMHRSPRLGRPTQRGWIAERVSLELRHRLVKHPKSVSDEVEELPEPLPVVGCAARAIRSLSNSNNLSLVYVAVSLYASSNPSLSRGATTRCRACIRLARRRSTDRAWDYRPGLVARSRVSPSLYPRIRPRLTPATRKAIGNERAEQQEWELKSSSGIPPRLPQGA